ncbi:YjzC family protein [Oceanobacillus chungangensis]|uniref:YjzC family protein n=1 Tax=Oceanobacillus chungangensis TaxID=1229152 RepID=A0A3D8PL42_9BACI|nr:YjzC family protein [Oceanobacillus chungangensis]RDW15905.1 YjzC family protein [Oceanobacillus chungangensis]
MGGHGSNQFRAGQKAPNNGTYIEIGETGSMVNNPQQIKLEAGDKFPENTNQNRIWVNQRNLSKPSVQG